MVGWKTAISLGSSNGIIGFYSVTDQSGGLHAPRGPEGFSTSIQSFHEPLHWPPPFISSRADITDVVLIRHITIAWWFLILLHLIAWLATMTWWHRRHRRSILS